MTTHDTDETGISFQKEDWIIQAISQCWYKNTELDCQGPQDVIPRAMLSCGTTGLDFQGYLGSSGLFLFLLLEEDFSKGSQQYMQFVKVFKKYLNV